MGRARRDGIKSSKGGAPSGPSPATPGHPFDGAPPVVNLSRADGIIADLHRLYHKLDAATHRLTGELVDRQIKIARILLERMAQGEMLARIEKLEAANRELEAQLIGGTGGNAAVRANAAPPFVVPTGGVTH